jgi:fatty-acyl-CoA synthase
VTGSDAKPGEVGEIWVRTRIRMNGYLNRPEATAETIDPNGWLHTGDIAAANPDETLQFRGRLKDMILRGGENIYASEVEAAIDSLSGVAQVAVVGLPDDRWGEIVAAMVVPERGVELSPQLLDAAVANQLAPFKRPVIWKFVESLPLTASGKPQKFKIVESMTPLGNGKAE